MNLVDSSGWVEYFLNDKKASQFSKPIETIKNLIVPSIVVFEVFKYFLRESDETHALKAISAMHVGNIVDLTVDLSLQAAKLSNSHKIAMADSIILATARKFNAMIWTMDTDFKKFDNVKFFGK